jgi:type III secretory pathway component EscS
VVVVVASCVEVVRTVVSTSTVLVDTVVDFDSVDSVVRAVAVLSVRVVEAVTVVRGAATVVVGAVTPMQEQALEYSAKLAQGDA